MELIKLKSFIDSKDMIKYFESDEVVMIPKKYAPKQTELRAVWVATVSNINFSRFTGVESFKKEFMAVLAKMEEFNLNCLFFQIRPMNDAFYRSELNPYSRFLIGGEEAFQEGKKPPLDCLDFMIKECHLRNIQFHGWLNPYRASSALNRTASRLHKKQIDELKFQEIEKMHPLNYVKKNPDNVVVSNNGMLILNPAKKAVQEFIVDTIMEICENYPQIDGIHFDDYFYPSEGLHPEADDTLEYQNSTVKQSLADFRRDNVTVLIKSISERITAFNYKNKTKIAFGISPFGIYKNGKVNGGSATLGSEAYVTWYADLKKWIDNNYLDYIMPQLYWEFEHAVARYADLVDWWSEACKGTKVKLFIGISIGRYGATPGYSSKDVFPDMIKYLNKFSNIDGVCLWSFSNLFPENDFAREGLEIIKKMWSKKALMPKFKELEE